MELRMAITPVAAFFIGLVLGGRDLFSALVCGGLAAVLCFIPLFVLGRYRFLKSAAGSVQTLVSVLICMLALLSMSCVVMRSQIGRLRYDLEHQRHRSTAPVQSFPNAPEESSHGIEE